MEVVALRGFGATVEEIAQLSGVSPRTVFRHYVSHDRLLAATVKDMFEASARHPTEGLPRLADDFDGWLEGLPRHVDDLDGWLENRRRHDPHQSGAHLRPGLLGHPRPNGKWTPALSEVAALRRQFRLQGVRYLTTLVWKTAGGVGDPPEDLVLTFALHLSAFATQALMIDFDQTPAEVGNLTADILKACVDRAIEAQRS